MNPPHTIYKQLLLLRENVCCFLLSDSEGSRQFSPSRHPGASNENHVLLDVLTSCLPKGARTPIAGGGLSSRLCHRLPGAAGTAWGPWQRHQSPPLLQMQHHRGASCHMSAHGSSFLRSQSKLKTTGICVSFNLPDR